MAVADFGPALDWLEARRAFGRLGYVGPGPWALAEVLAGRGFTVEGLDEARTENLETLRPEGAHNAVVEVGPGVLTGGTPFGGLYIVSRALELNPPVLADALKMQGALRLLVTGAAARRWTELIEALESYFDLVQLDRVGRDLHFELRRSAGKNGWAGVKAPARAFAIVEALAFEAGRAEAAAQEAVERSIEEGVGRLGEATRRRQRERVRLRRALADRRAELTEIRRSTRFRLAHALVSAARPGRDTVRLPRRVFNLVRDRNLPISERGPDGPNVEPLRHRLERDLERFEAHVRAVGARKVVFMLSGTTFVQSVRANRPIRLTRILRERGIPVLFSFHGELQDPDLPENSDPGLTQLPIAFTETVIERIAEMDLAEAQKTFIVSYPHPAVMKSLGRFAVAGWANLYDCRDDWEAFAAVGAAKWYDPAVERFVVGQCDRSFAVSWPLRDKIRAFAPTRTIETSPNAYDPGFLSPNYRRSPGREIVIGYFGHLTQRWFDWAALAEVAAARPNWRFEIIGHQAPEDPGCPGNVVLLGPKKHAEICEYAARWHAAIIPFKVGVLADAVDPIKIYEYFGLGLPVVSFRMPQIAGYPYTETVESPAAFAEALDRAVASPPDPAVLSDFLSHNTWRNRVDQLLDAADEVMASPAFEKRLGAGPRT